MATLHKLIQRCSKGTGEAARSWGGSAVLGRQRGLGGSPHSRFAVVPPTRALPWFPPLALCRGFPHSRFASRSEVYFCPGT
ncbi:MAG: hypothetical protein F6K55_30350 [Moorea sp. SIO4A3]|nr:hypothetical protein [Moorena sp. SIO4A3]